MWKASNQYWFLLLLFVLAGCSRSERQKEAAQKALASRVRMQRDGSILLSEEDRAAFRMATTIAGVGETAGGRVAYGRVIASPGAEVQVSAPITGTVAGVPDALLGSQVTVGAPLLRLAPAFDASERASLGVQAAEIDGRIHELTHRVTEKDAAAARARELSPERIVSLAKLQAAEADAASAHAELEAARREREAITRSVGSLVVVRAPMSGTVAELKATMGEPVRRGDPLATILTAGGRVIDVGVAPGEPPTASYAVEIGSAWVPASLIGSARVASADGLRHDLIAVPPAGATLVPGTSVTVRIGTGDVGGVTLPATAVVPTPSGDLVFVELAPGKYRPRTVHVIDRSADSVRIDAGIAAGERVVTTGAMELWGEVAKAGGTKG
jgi:cobalt-zinc-cadmium efflux system membrane fusion protein